MITYRYKCARCGLEHEGSAGTTEIPTLGKLCKCCSDRLAQSKPAMKGKDRMIIDFSKRRREP